MPNWDQHSVCDTVEIYKSADGEADPTHVAMADKIYLGFVVELYLGVYWTRVPTSMQCGDGCSTHFDAFRRVWVWSLRESSFFFGEKVKKKQASINTANVPISTTAYPCK